MNDGRRNAAQQTTQFEEEPPMRVALTFDAEYPSRPHGRQQSVGLILETLAKRSVQATFFLQGRWLKAHPDVGRSIAQAGHVIGNHSHYHTRMSWLSDDGIRSDIASAEATIKEVVGVDSRPWFRCPFGDGADDSRVVKLIAQTGYRNVDWDVDPQDWNEDTTQRQILDRVLKGLERGPRNSIVLLHSWPITTAAALGPLLDHLQMLDADLVTVDEICQRD